MSIADVPDALKDKYTFSRMEIAQHSEPNDYWLIIDGKVFKFENFAHPGGWQIHAPFAGGRLDATSLFMIKHGFDINIRK